MSLNGAVVLVTRPAGQGQNLCHLIEQQGGIAENFPTLEIKALPTNDKIRRTLASLEVYNWLFFVSANAVNFAVSANNGKIDVGEGTKIAAIGKSTAKMLQQHQIKVDLIPDKGFNSEALLQSKQLQDLSGQKCLIFRGQGGLEKLAHTLTARGAQTQYLELYQRCKPQTDNHRLVALLEQNKLAAVTMTSGEALENLIEMLDRHSIEQLLKLPLVVISSRIKQIAEQLGFSNIAVTQSPADVALLETLTTLINGDNSGRSK